MSLKNVTKTNYVYYIGFSVQNLISDLEATDGRTDIAVHRNTYAVINISSPESSMWPEHIKPVQFYYRIIHIKIQIFHKTINCLCIDMILFDRGLLEGEGAIISPLRLEHT